MDYDIFLSSQKCGTDIITAASAADCSGMSSYYICPSDEDFNEAMDVFIASYTASSDADDPDTDTNTDTYTDITDMSIADMAMDDVWSGCYVGSLE